MKSLVLWSGWACSLFKFKHFSFHKVLPYPKASSRKKMCCVNRKTDESFILTHQMNKNEIKNGTLTLKSATAPIFSALRVTNPTYSYISDIKKTTTNKKQKQNNM